MIARKRSVVLGYHGVAESDLAGDMFLLQVAPSRFRTQLRLLRAAGFSFVTAEDFAGRLTAGTRPRGLAVITFDDALRNNLTRALPILNEFRVPATVYVATGFLGQQNPWISDPAEGMTMTAEEIAELAGAGWEIGAHTRSHADLAELGPAECEEEIRSSMEMLEQLTGRPVRTFAYPFGRYGPAALEAARRCGLSAALTTGSGKWDPLELTRAMVGGADPPFVLILKMLDLYEPIMAAPPLRVARGVSKQLRRQLLARRALHEESSAS